MVNNYLKYEIKSGSDICSYLVVKSSFMQAEQARSILIMPISITHNNESYDVEIRGKAIPSGKFFTCEIKGMGIFIIEAVANPLTKKYNWVMDTTGQHGHLMPLIRKEIENQMRLN